MASCGTFDIVTSTFRNAHKEIISTLLISMPRSLSRLNYQPELLILLDLNSGVKAVALKLLSAVKFQLGH